MTSHYLFEPEFCNVASGWEKGIVEKNVQDRRGNSMCSGRAMGERNAGRRQKARPDPVVLTPSFRDPSFRRSS